MRRAAGLALATVVLVVLALVTVVPTGSYLHQGASLARASAQLAQLRSQNSALSAQVAKLQTDAEIGLLARQDYGLVAPGEEAYAVLPAPARPKG